MDRIYFGFNSKFHLTSVADRFKKGRFVYGFSLIVTINRDMQFKLIIYELPVDNAEYLGDDWIRW